MSNKWPEPDFYDLSDVEGVHDIVKAVKGQLTKYHARDAHLRKAWEYLDSAQSELLGWMNNFDDTVYRQSFRKRQGRPKKRYVLTSRFDIRTEIDVYDLEHWPDSIEDRLMQLTRFGMSHFEVQAPGLPIAGENPSVDWINLVPMNEG